MGKNFIINWNEIVLMNDGDEEEARHMLGIFFGTSLPEIKILFRDYYNSHDIAGLRAVSHRLIGTLLYLSCPDLAKAASSFHKQLKEEANNQEVLKEKYELLCKAIKDSEEYYRQIF